MVNTDGPARKLAAADLDLAQLAADASRPRSKSRTRTPARARWMAAARPPTPAPMTIADFTCLYVWPMRLPLET